MQNKLYYIHKSYIVIRFNLFEICKGNESDLISLSILN